MRCGRRACLPARACRTCHAPDVVRRIPPPVPCVCALQSPPPQKAEAQLDAAIAYPAAFLDGYLGKSALAQLRAKLAADYLITPVK